MGPRRGHGDCPLYPVRARHCNMPTGYSSDNHYLGWTESIPFVTEAVAPLVEANSSLPLWCQPQPHGSLWPVELGRTRGANPELPLQRPLTGLRTVLALLPSP